MNKTITLKKASSLDDIQCPDGELVGADYMFTSAPDQPAADLHPDLYSSFRPPEGARFLCTHPLSDGGLRLIFQLPTGAVTFRSAGAPITDGLVTGGCETVIKAVAVGCYLVLHTRMGVYYALATAAGYRWLGFSPGAPSLAVSAASRSLPPYSYADGELPVLNLTVSVGDDTPRAVLDWLAGTASACSPLTRSNIIAAVREALREFLAAVEGSGLYFYPVKGICAWRLRAGQLWCGSIPARFKAPFGGDSLRLAITNADCSDGVLYLTLRLSRSPYSLAASDVDVPLNWEDIIAGREFVTAPGPCDIMPENVSSPVWLDTATRGFTVALRQLSDTDFEAFPEILGSIPEVGEPEALFSIGGKLLTVFAAEGGSRLSASPVGLPFVVAGTSCVAGEGIVHLTQSLRSLSSGQFGEFPIYAFCRDGIRALTPDGGSYRDVQLISRFVAFPDGFAPLPGATCFLTSAGVMKIEGAALTQLSDDNSPSIDEDCRIIYLYKENSLLIYRKGESEAYCYSFSRKQWFTASLRISGHHYDWPNVWAMVEEEAATVCCRLCLEFPEQQFSGDSGSSGGGSSAQLVPVVTRPLKLGDPFALKKLDEIEAVWPGGQLLPVKVYGALRLNKWYFLGLSPRGHMKMRGSGWRFFRVETVAVSDGRGGYSLPTLHVITI